MRRTTSRSIHLMASVVALAAVAAPGVSRAAEGERVADLVEESSVQGMLQRWVDDFAHDPTLAAPLAFGVLIGEEWWNITAEPGEDGRAHRVALGEGSPETPSFYFKTDTHTLASMDSGEMTPGTALSGSRAERLMSVDAMEGFAPGPGEMATIFRTAFHFWKRGNPEIFRFGEMATLPRHGAEVGILFYQPGFRSAWVNLGPGQHANAEEEDKTNPFPSMLIWIDGRGKAKIGGREVDIEGGEAVMIPAGVAHEFWNPFEEPFRGFMLAFGEGA
ncbi:MAG: cupin domain-containing protein [Acidobacteriota bacterium]|nr:cupin domain-containing protein [Acidobacteriota bacterium]